MYVSKQPCVQPLIYRPWRPKEDFIPFLVQDYLTGTVVLPELMCGKPRLKVTSYSKLGFLKFQDIPFTYLFSLFSGIYFVAFKRRNNFLLYSKRSSKLFEKSFDSYFLIRNSQEKWWERKLFNLWNLMGKLGKISIYMYLKEITHNTHTLVSYSFCKWQLTSNNKPSEATNNWMQNTR